MIAHALGLAVLKAKDLPPPPNDGRDKTIPGGMNAEGEQVKGQGPARLGPFRQEYERNKKKILMSQDTCGICGKPVDKTLPGADPMGPTIDHIIPIAKGGHPADISNLQLAHRCCNRQKSDKLMAEDGAQEEYSNRNLPWSTDWKTYSSSADQR